jgi:hypothetical protein
MARILATAMALAALGCAQAHGTDEVQPGIYELRIETEADACSPSRAVGAMGAVPVLVEDGALDVPVPEVEAPLLTVPRVRLAPSASFHAEADRRLEGCDGAVHEEWTVLESGAEGFEVLHTQRWENLAGCADARERVPSAPEADCTSERRLRYDLEGACLAPCRLRLVAGGTIECRCE